ncbi:MAG: hypothetical protein R3244_13115, partial [Thermoanaerobaculia bacterium]|nr:hypothetical protein [Thermoanaerobaculia bacterium]
MTRRLPLALPLCIALFAFGCTPADHDEPASTPQAPEAAAQQSSPSSVIHVEATEYAFTAPPKLPSGWVTLHFENTGEQTHFLLLWKLPPERTFDEFAAEISQPFNVEYKKYRAGEVTRDEFLESLGAVLPEWFQD